MRESPADLALLGEVIDFYRIAIIFK